MTIPPLRPALRVPAALLVPAAPFIAAVATGTSQSTAVHHPHVHLCGVFRWAVKTLTDPKAGAIDPSPADTTVHQLVSLPTSIKVPDLGRGGDGPPFTPVELKTYRITANLGGWKISVDDGDIHLVVHDPTTDESMIVEFPDPACTTAASGTGRAEMTGARQAIETSCPGNHLTTSFHKLAGEATITGVGFFDKMHRQTGLAKNGIELHPALGFQSAACRPAPKPG